MSNSNSMNDTSLKNGEAERVILSSVHSDGSLPPTELHAFGENSTLSENVKQSGLETNKGIAEFEYGGSLGEFSMGSYGDLQNSSPRLDSHYGSSMGMGFQKYSPSRTPTLSPFASGGMDDIKPFRNSLGGMFSYGETAMEPYPRDLTLNNLQDVMEEDLYSTPSFSNNTMPSHLLSKPSYYHSYNMNFHQRLSMNNNNFVLSSYDDDYSHPYNPLTPQSRNSYTPLQNMYVDSSTMYVDNSNDFISESSYSPRTRLTPIVAPSPHYNEGELSPRRMFSQSTSQSRLLSSNDDSRLQRSFSAMAPISNSSMEMSYSSSSFKRKDSMKPAWQTNDIDSYRGHIKEMSRDHNGCRILQQCLDECADRIIPMIYDEVGNELTELMMDSFGNYLFQKLLDVSSTEQRRSVLQRVKFNLVDASYNVHGTRSVQKLIQVCQEPDMVKDIMDVLKTNIANLSSHSNGNHVIQRCLQFMSEEYRTVVFEEVVESCLQISTHRHGCCVVQRCLDSAPQYYHDKLLDAIIDNSVNLICNPFGNYVIQYLIEHGKDNESERITRCVLGRVAELSCQKYSSNVIEKIICCVNDTIRGEIVSEIASSSNLRELLHDRYANYVIQKALKRSNPEQQQLLLGAIRPYEEELSKSTGGKHILTQLNDIMGNNNFQSWNRT